MIHYLLPLSHASKTVWKRFLQCVCVEQVEALCIHPFTRIHVMEIAVYYIFWVRESRRTGRRNNILLNSVISEGLMEQSWQIKVLMLLNKAPYVFNFNNNNQIKSNRWTGYSGDAMEDDIDNFSTTWTSSSNEFFNTFIPLIILKIDSTLSHLKI